MDSLAVLRRSSLVLVIAIAAASAAAAQQRLALVVGNAAYKTAPLSNPVNDARAIAQALRDAGFTVMLHTDVDHRGLLEAVRGFGDRLQQGGVGIFYYAGHGMQIKGRNYLIPIGANIEREDEVAYGALDAQAVLDKMDTAANGTNLMILDACRNNPFTRSVRSSVPGLAQMDAPVGTMVAFSTAPGSVASDGQGSNGLYTQHLLAAMRVPGAKVEDVFKRVRAGVRRESQGKQIPWEATSLEGDLYFVEPAAPSMRPAAVTPPAKAPAAVTRQTVASAVKPAEVSIPSPAPEPKPQAKKAAPARPSNAQGYTVGDKWNYQVIDRWKGEVIRNFSRRVGKLQPDGGWLNADGSLAFDAHGRLLSIKAADGEQRQIVPHAPRWWPDMQAGQVQPFRYEVTSTPASGPPRVTRYELEGRVVAIEAIKVPAGEFQAYRVEYKGTSTRVGRAGLGRIRQTFWYAPELHTMIAAENESTWDGRPDVREREELTSFSLIKPPAGR